MQRKNKQKMDTISKVNIKERQKTRNVGWIEIERYVIKIANSIKRSGKKYSSIYGIPRGGLIPAVLLSHKLNLPLADELKNDKKMLIVDDISDSGKTLEKIKAKNNKNDIATIFVRRGSTVMPRFYGKKIGKEWLIFPWEEKA